MRLQVKQFAVQQRYRFGVYILVGCATAAGASLGAAA
jgi:hypothetical protein